MQIKIQMKIEIIIIKIMQMIQKLINQIIIGLYTVMKKINSIMSSGGIVSSKLNMSDIFSILMHKNEKLNATVNTIDTWIQDSQY